MCLHDVGAVHDATYMLGAVGMRGTLQGMYNLHVSLTYECLHYVDEGAPDLQSHVTWLCAGKHCQQTE